MIKTCLGAKNTFQTGTLKIIMRLYNNMQKKSLSVHMETVVCRYFDFVRVFFKYYFRLFFFSKKEFHNFIANKTESAGAAAAAAYTSTKQRIFGFISINNTITMSTYTEKNAVRASTEQTHNIVENNNK